MWSSLEYKTVLTHASEHQRSEVRLDFTGWGQSVAHLPVCDSKFDVGPSMVQWPAFKSPPTRLRYKAANMRKERKHAATWGNKDLMRLQIEICLFWRVQSPLKRSESPGVSCSACWGGATTSGSVAQTQPQSPDVLGNLTMSCFLCRCHHAGPAASGFPEPQWCVSPFSSAGLVLTHLAKEEGTDVSHNHRSGRRRSREQDQASFRSLLFQHNAFVVLYQQESRSSRRVRPF